MKKNVYTDMVEVGVRIPRQLMKDLATAQRNNAGKKSRKMNDYHAASKLMEIFMMGLASDEGLAQQVVDAAFKNTVGKIGGAE